MERFIPQYEPVLNKNETDSVSEQVSTGWIGAGKKTEEFENKVSSVSCSKFCVSTVNGTCALIMSLESLGIPKKSKVVFPDYTFIAGANAIKFTGRDVDLVDIKEDTLCMDPDLLLKKIKEDENISSVMFVNHNGYCGEDILKVRDICNKYSKFMIEDSSQSFGINNYGITGDVGVFSFSVPKIITTGQGGALITNNEEYFIRAKRIRDHGDNWRKKREHDYLGINLKFNDILSAIGISQINRIEEIKKTRKRIWKNYGSKIKIYNYGYDFTWMVIHRSSNSDKIIDELSKNNIQAVKYYKSIHENKVYRYCGNNFPVSKKISKELVYLPSSHNLEDFEIFKICDIVSSNSR